MADEAAAVVDKLFGQVEELREAGRAEEALPLNEQLIELCDPSPRRGFQLEALSGRLRKIDLLRALSRDDEAIGVCDEAVRRFGSSTDPQIHWRLAIALSKKAQLLFAQQRVAECVEALDDIQRRFADEPSAEDADAADRLQGELAGALDAKSVALAHLGRQHAASAVDGELIGRYGSAESEDVRSSVCRALDRRAEGLQAQGYPEAALESWAAAIERSAGAMGEKLRGLHARALHEQLELLWLTGHTVELSLLAEGMIEQADDSSREGRRQLAQGMSIRSALLAHAKRYEDAVAAADALTDGFPESSDAFVRGRVAQALANKVFALSELGRMEEAEAVQQQLLASYGEEALALAGEHAGHAAGVPGEHAEMQRTGALYSRAWFLHHLGRTDEALVVLDSLLVGTEAEAEAGDGNEDEQFRDAIETARALREQIEEEAAGA